MTTLTVQLPEDVKTLAESRAAEAGCADVGEYLARLIRGEAAAAPQGLMVGSDEELEALLLRRLDGRFFESVEDTIASLRRMPRKGTLSS